MILAKTDRIKLLIDIKGVYVDESTQLTTPAACDLFVKIVSLLKEYLPVKEPQA